MSEPSYETPRTAWDALEGGWYYLGRQVADGFDIATLVPEPRQVGGRSEPNLAKARRRPDRSMGVLAAAFTSQLAAHEFLAAAPAGIELLGIEAADLRAKEEWLRALIDQGTRTLVFDPSPAALHASAHSPKAIAVHTALGFILSQRNASACL